MNEVEPRLIVRNKSGEFVVLQNFGHVVIDAAVRKLGVSLRRFALPDGVELKRAEADLVELLYQPDPRSQRTVRCGAKVEERVDAGGRKEFVVVDQVGLLSFSSFFATSVHITIVLQLRIYFCERNSGVLHLHEGPE